MATTYKTPQWLMPENSNQDNVSNYSMVFDGVDDNIEVSNLPALNTATALTFSFWGLKATGESLGIEAFSTSTSRAVLYWWTNDTVYLSVRNGGTPSSASGALADFGNWHHFAGTYEGSIGTIKLYIDGSLIDTQTGAPATTADLSSLFKIGKSNGTSFNAGNLDEVAIWDSVLSAVNITAIYNSGTPTDITSLSPIAYWKMGEQARYNGTNWLVPNSISTNYSNFSMNFDGVNDTIDVGTASLGITTAISVSAWVKTTNTLSTYKAIVCEDATGGAERNWTLLLGNAGKVRWIIWNTDGTIGFVIRAAANEINDGDWHHVLATYDGTTDADGIKLYVDGNLESGTATSTGIRSTVGAEPAVGSLTGAAGYWWDGNIDEVSVFDAVKVVADVSDGTQPIDITSESNLVAWWRMGEDASFNTNWTVPDQIGSNDGTSANMIIDDLTGDAPGITGGGTSSGMTIEDRVGDAPNSDSNSVSFNMFKEDRETNVP